MNKIMALALTVFTCSVAWSQNIPATLFEQQFVRNTAKPVAVSNTINLPPMVHGPFTLNIANGDRDGGNRVSSAQITLNGVQVFGPSDFNQNIANLQASVNLQSVNQLTVELASKPGSFIEVSLIGEIDPDRTTNTTSTLIGNSGGTINLAGVGQLVIPPGALSTTASVEISTVVSPYMDFLVQDSTSGQGMSFVAVPKIRIKSSDFFQKPLRLSLQVPNLSSLVASGNSIALTGLIQQVGGDDEAIDGLTPINTDPCADNMVCATIFPEWFGATNPADPNDPVLQLAVTLIPARSTTSFRLWTTTNITPQSSSLQADINSNLTFSALVTLQKNFTFQTPLSFLENPCPISQGAFGSIISRPIHSVCLTSRMFSPRNGHQHQGVDLGTKNSASDLDGNQDVLSVKSGTAFAPGVGSGGAGQRIWVQHDSTVNGFRSAGGLSTFYAHLKPGSYQVAAGAAVADSETIATSDATGAAVGTPHLHFESWFDGFPVDPEPLLRDDLSKYFDPSPVSGEGLSFELMMVVRSPTLTVLVDSIPSDQIALLGAGKAVKDQIAATDVASLCASVAPCNIWTSLRMLSPRFGGIREVGAGNIVISRSLTLSKRGNGTGTVTSSATGINCPAACSSQSEAFTSGTVTLTAAPASDSIFAGWSGDCSGTGLTITVSLGLSTSCIADFELIKTGPTISVTLAGNGTGNVQSSSSGINCGGGGTVCTASFPFGPGASVSLFTTPATGSFFESWTGCSSVDLGFCDVLVQSNTQNAEITATFLQSALAITSVSCNVISGTNFSDVHMVITAQATGGVGFWVTDGGGNQTTQSCGAWSGPPGAFGISCTRGSDQPVQSTSQFTEDHPIFAPFPFPRPLTFSTQVFLSTAVPIPFPSPLTLAVNGPSCTV